MQKKWAVRENFDDIVHFICDLGDEDINHHLREGSQRATYTSKISVDSFIKCFSDRLEWGLLSRLINAVDFSLLCDETTDMADRGDLSIFVRYVDSRSCKVKEEFIALIEITGSKGVEALCNKIQEVLTTKWVDISLLHVHNILIAEIID